MGLGFFQPARIAPQFQRTERVSASPPRIGFSIDSEDGDRSNPFARPERATVRAWFGEGTLSGPSAAVIALDRGLWSARRVVPSLPQEGANFNEQIADQREARSEQAARAQAAACAEQSVAAVTNQARNFINDINEAAGVALAKIRGEEPAEPTGASVEIGGEAFQFGAVGAATNSVTSTDSGGRLRINALV
ncbi:MAG: hypothetical protein QGG73_04555 [Candidatus Hydrogenedentes bacterium]|jgi:hypothetical protein|nr:hypothetical protein [Candidatus Hydrogenedentota bacterium]